MNVTANKPNIYQIVSDAEAGPDLAGTHDSYIDTLAGGWIIHCTSPITARDIALTALDRVSLWEWGVTAEPYGKVIRHPWRTVTYTHRVVVVGIR
jgi:hypothetical protein